MAASKRSPAARASWSAFRPAVESLVGNGMSLIGSLLRPSVVRSHSFCLPPLNMTLNGSATFGKLESCGTRSMAARHSQ